MATLTLTMNNSTYGSVTGAGTYTAGTSVTIKATANDGYTFMSWLDNAGRVVWGAESYTFTINEDTTLQAVFMSEVDNIEIYGFCNANCKHRVLSAGQTMHLIQEMLVNGGQIPTGFVPTTAVNSIIEQNTGAMVRLFVGTQAQYNAWTGDKNNLFAIISDDTSLQDFTRRLESVESAVATLNTTVANVINTEINKIVSGEKAVGIANYASADKSKGTIEERLTNLGFKQGSFQVIGGLKTTQNINKITRQGNYAIVNIDITYTEGKSTSGSVAMMGYVDTVAEVKDLSTTGTALVSFTRGGATFTDIAAECYFVDDYSLFISLPGSGNAVVNNVKIKNFGFEAKPLN